MSCFYPFTLCKNSHFTFWATQILSCSVLYLLISICCFHSFEETADKCIGAGDIIQVAADLTIETDVERLVQKTIEHYKQLDVLVSVNECVELLIHEHTEQLK